MVKNSILDGKKIVLGVTGGIAAYKSVYLLRLLVGNGASVQVVGTQNSLNFIGRATWESLSGRMPLFDTFENSDSSKISHIILAQEVDAVVIAPATGNIIGKAACGIADDLLSTILMAATVPVLFAPGMNTAMYENQATVNNIEMLGKRRNIFFVEPGIGELACGTSGKGRMAEPHEIMQKLEEILSPSLSSGIKWLVTGGATKEFIDPVRYITNGSSGRTGIAIAEAALSSGGDVTFIGVNVETAVSRNIKKIKTVTAAETSDAVRNFVNETDIFVMSAAVADYTPNKSPSKIKKGEGNLVIELSRTEDILLTTIGMMKPGSVRIGFAAETDNLEVNATLKLRKKKLDMIVANLVSEKFDPFGAETNSVKIITESGTESFENVDKYELG
ncbi:MAG TPA: bifunctional phosphopantothenoylcysteine decarboxylase/phosphopantothenate--cysteine ligase CoaBC, partial [bacterium]|nr:bifunctional phosphopantothenoylcysteine decarboxylase/phosphopantothenate--cysteine ligase CoaBC [bacterium]